MNVFGEYVEATHLFLVAYMVAVPLAALVLVFVHGLCTVLWRELWRK